MLVTPVLPSAVRSSFPEAASFSPLAEAGVVARLRAAGCVFAEDEAALLIAAAPVPDELERLVARRVAGQPLEHVLGWAEFCGLRIEVDPGVFVPRWRTEFLAGCAVALARPGAVVLDLCCGTGALSAALAEAVPGLDVHAADIDPAAVACAARNVRGGRVYCGDLYEPLPSTLHGRVDILVVNAPYVPTEAISLLPPEARLHEAREALDGGADGYAVQRRVAAGARAWLASGGHVLIETSQGQAPGTAEVFASQGMTTEVLHCEERDATVVVARM
ncbi:putative protein N(5)-glutamine methyltransferase [Longispora albida]|uniref:putative protein N(5)-glutamine methyltransferase n=1 Tax=Longispora albida TaxID=203523 RepID=UPI0003A11FE1|nr:putative protein N(5)-glutamine methyltransferase [Longispora albida]